MPTPFPPVFLAQADPAPLTEVSTGYGAGNFTMMMIMLILMVMGLGAVYLYIRRFGTIRRGFDGKLEVLETRPLGGRQYLMVGKYGRDTFLLGICPGRIDYLCRLEPDASPEEGFEEALAEAGKGTERRQPR